jgi:glycosyltransferase involved in cell wall biosynthesis
MAKVSVLMSVHNGEAYLREAVDSVLAQTFDDFEFIIVDDASTDGTARILDRYDDPRIVRLSNESNLGLTRSLNRGLERAECVYVARHDDDDISFPERLARQVSILDNDPGAVLVAGNTEIIDADGNTLARSRRDCDPDLVGWYLMFHNHIAGHGQVMFRADVARRLGGYREDMTCSQDHEFWLRMIEAGRIVIANEVFLKSRVHDAGVSRMRADEQERLSLTTSQEAIRRHGGPDLNMDKVRRLRCFWSGDFRALEGPRELHRLLRRIAGSLGKARAGRKQRRAVGRQFLRWAGKTSLRREFGPHVRLTVYAFRWAPAATIRHWLWDVWAVRMGGGNRREGAIS